MPVGDAVACFDAPETTFEAMDKEREARIAAHAARVAAELAAMGAAGPARGIARPVFRSDGEYYVSVSEAARQNEGARADYICQAIRHGRRCRGFGWAYADDIPPDFWESYIQDNAGLACAWPWQRGRQTAALCRMDFKPSENEVSYAAAG